MTSPDTFLRAILADPADDAIRLIYADWLDGQGREEYGEFIRVQGVAMLEAIEKEEAEQLRREAIGTLGKK